MVEIKQFTFNLFSENTIIIRKDGGNAVVIDPGFYNDSEKAAFLEFLTENSVTPAAILLTHAHPDHIFGAAYLQREYGIPVYMHPEDVKLKEYSERFSSKLGLREPDSSFKRTDIEDGQVLAVEGFSFEVIHTPGHSPGSVCYYDREDGMIFTGDTLFAGSIGRSDLMHGDYDSLIVSIMEKLMALDSAVEVYPGHGGRTTIGYERMNNPFLEPFNESEFCQTQTNNE